MFHRIVTGFVAPGLLALGMAGFAAGGALAQSESEVQALKDEIESLKAGQAEIQKSLDDIKSILEPLRRRTQARTEFEPKDVELAGAARKGSATAPVTLIEFTDYQCPFCRRHFMTTMPQIQENYVDTGKVQYVLKEFPIPSLHPGAAKASEGALCAGDQDKYWEMHNLIFQNPRAVAPDQLKDKAEELDLDMAAFSDCLDSAQYAQAVQADMATGRDLGVRGTPSFVLGLTDPDDPSKIRVTRFIRGAQDYAAFKQAIDELLEQGS